MHVEGKYIRMQRAAIIDYFEQGVWTTWQPRFERPDIQGVKPRGLW